MPLKIPVKAGSITNLTDARFFAAFEVQYIGFCFDPQSPNYISPQNALAIKGWIHGPKIVAEFANQDLDNVQNIIQFFEPDVLELTDKYFSGNICLIPGNLPLIRKTTLENSTFISAENVLFILTTEQEDLSMPTQQIPIMLDITNTPFQIESFLADAIQIQGNTEKEIGLRDYDKLADLMESLVE